jgi:hypothetical protein
MEIIPDREFLKDFAARWPKVVSAMAAGLVDGMRKFERDRIIKSQLSGRNGNYGLNRFTGTAANAWVVKKYNSGIDFVAVLGLHDRAWYLKAHQHYNFSGEVKPKNKKFLTIPVARVARGRSAADFPEMRIMKTKAGKLLLVRDLEKGRKGQGKIEIMFALKNRVFIPKRLYITEEFQTFGRQFIQAAIDTRMRGALSA